MTLDEALNFAPVFVLAFFRLAGMMLAAPLFGAARVPRRVKVLLALVLTAGFVPSLPPVTRLPASHWELAAAMGAELAFGLAMGTALTLTFVAIHWAGELIGQQMGLGLGQLFDPQLGSAGTAVGDLYFMFAMVVFLLANGHHAFLRGVRETFETMPLLSIAMTPELLDLLAGLTQSAAQLALQLAGPVLLTMLVVDVVLGFIGKTIPQMNVIAAALSVRSLLGMLVVMVGMAISSEVMRDSLLEALEALATAWRR